MWWHFRTPTKDGLSPKEPTGYESPVIWLWFRNTAKRKVPAAAGDIVLVWADLALWPIDVSDVAFDGLASPRQLVRGGLTLNRWIGPNLATYPHPRSWSSVLNMDAAAAASADRVGAATNTALRFVRSAAPPSSALCVDAAQVDFGLMRAHRCPERRA